MMRSSLILCLKDNTPLLYRCVYLDDCDCGGTVFGAWRGRDSRHNDLASVSVAI